MTDPPDSPSPAVPFRRHFPEEVLSFVVEHTVSFYEDSTESRASSATLAALRLSSRQLCRLATVVFYQDIVLPTPAAARKLLDTIDTSERLEIVRRSARTIWFGSSDGSARDQDGGWMAEVLAVLGAQSLLLVSFHNVQLRQPTLWTLQSK